MTTRRSFLQTLGMAAAGVAFGKTLPWSTVWHVPRDLHAYDGPVNMYWILADAVATLADNLPAEQFHYVAKPHRFGQQPMQQWGIDLRFDEDDLKRSRKEFHSYFIEPAMIQMANTLREYGAKTCFALELPTAVEHAARLCNPEHGFDLRFCRAFDIGGCGEYEDDNGKLVAWERPPGYINRFDVAVAN